MVLAMLSCSDSLADVFFDGSNNNGDLGETSIETSLSLPESFGYSLLFPER